MHSFRSCLISRIAGSCAACTGPLRMQASSNYACRAIATACRHGSTIVAAALPLPAGRRPTTLLACAGIVPTKFAAALVENPELEQAQRDATLVKRLGRPEDMAAAVAYLCSEDASYVTGETVVVSGGLQSRL